jgi:hypothetical protein
MAVAGCGGAPPAASPQSGPLPSPASSGAGAASTCADAQTCTSVGLDLAKHGEDARAAVALEKACMLRDIDACAALAPLLRSDANPGRATAPARKGCRVEGASDETRPARGVACRIWGEAAQRDMNPATGIEATGVRAAFEDGCKLGDAPSCTWLQQLNEQRSFDADIKQHVGQPTFRQQLARSGVPGRIACRADPASKNDPNDMFADQTLLADKESALDACAVNGGTKVRLVWSADGSRKVNMVKVLSGDAAVGACIKQALLGARARRVETCVATTYLGH